MECSNSQGMNELDEGFNLEADISSSVRELFRAWLSPDEWMIVDEAFRTDKPQSDINKGEL